jgi:hypothetical protein
LSEHAVILDPAARVQGARAALKPLDTLQGKVVGFIDNSKPNFQHLVDDLANVLVSRYGVASVVKHRKRAASMAASADVYKDLGEKCDIVITGSGD